MKRKPVEALCLILVSILIIMTAAPGALCTRAYAVSGQNIEDEITGIFKDEMAANNQTTVQGLIDSAYCKNAGSTTDWFVFSLIQYAGAKYDYTNYAVALKKNGVSSSPTTKERYALNFAAMGTNTAYVKKTANEEIGELGIMSNIFGLHLIANGFSSSKYTADEVIEKLLSEQYEDGGWALNTSVGVSDTDITAMTVQCLAPYYKSNHNVRSAVDKAINLLSSKQSDDGGFSSYYSTKNPESAAQVIVALTSLGINPLTDSRFIKNENSAVDFMLSFRASDRGFTHTSGEAYNLSATTQVLYSLVSIYRFQHNKGRLYELNAGVKTVLPEETTAPSTAKPSTPSKPAQGGSPVSPSATKAATTAQVSKTAQPSADRTQAVSRTKREITHRTTAQKTAQSETAKNETKRSPGKTSRAASKTENAAQTAATATEAAVISESSTYELTSAFSDKENIAEDTSAEPETSQSEAEKDENRIPLKTACVAAVWVLALIASIILLAKGNRKIINFVIIAAVAGAVTAGVAISDIQRPEEFYSVEGITSSEDTVTVTMSIDCKTVAGRGDEKITPSDGIILEKTQFTLPEGSTAYDCLIYASKKYKIQIEDSSKMLNDHRSAYIAGINYLFEFDYGEMSGWMFSVNGTFGEVGCGEYTLSEGDNIEWRYTTNIGEDLR